MLQSMGLQTAGHDWATEPQKTLLLFIHQLDNNLFIRNETRHFLVLFPASEQQTGSKWEKEYVKAVHCHPAYLTYVQSTLWETMG